MFQSFGVTFAFSETTFLEVTKCRLRDNRILILRSLNFCFQSYIWMLRNIFLNDHVASGQSPPVAALVFDSFVYMFKFVCFSKVWHNTIFYFNKIKYIFRFYFVDICNSLHSTPTRLPEIWIKQIKHCGTLVQFGADFARLFLFIVASNWGRNPST